MTAQWFTIASDRVDFGPVICCNVWPDEVTSTLGPNGFPVLNPNFNAEHSGDPQNQIHETNSGTGELTWWNPALNAAVTFTGTSTVTLPINQNMYPPNGGGSDDANGFQGVILTGTLVVPTTESVTFNMGSDDDSFLYLNNSLLVQNGGVHPNSAAPVTTDLLSPGSYLLTLFYVDRQQTGASLQFSLDTQDVTLTATPLPAGLPLFATGLGGLGLLGWRSKRKNAAAIAA